MTPIEQSTSGRSGNLLTLWPDALSPARIPKYPTYEILTAKGGESQHDWDEISRLTTRPAESGELLRDADMKYVMNVRKNLLYRTHVIRRLCDPEVNPMQYEEKRKQQIEFCRSSILYYCNVFCWTLDPRLTENSNVPFVTFPFQDDVLTWMVWVIAMHEDGVIEKSRDMGASWMVCVVFSWLMNFYRSKMLFLTSLREEDVDDGTEHGLFGKMRHLQKCLPPWLRGGWEEGRHKIDKNLMMTIPATKSICKGQKTESTGGRSGRATAYLADEFAHVNKAIATQEATSGLTPTMFYVSTHYGHGTEFSRMCDDPATLKKSLHYKVHPLKGELWKRKERSKSRYTEETWNREHEMLREGSVSGRVFPSFISSDMQKQAIKAPWRHVRYEADGPLYSPDPRLSVLTSSDYGGSDPTFTLWAQWKPPPLEYALDVGMMLLIFAEMGEKGVRAWELRHMLNREKWLYSKHVGDWRTGNQKGPEGKSWIDYLGADVKEPVHSQYFGRMLSPQDIGPKVSVVGGYVNATDPIKSADLLMNKPGALAIRGDLCPKLVRCLQNWSYPLDPKTNQPKSNVDPIDHPQWSHGSKAFVYLVHNEAPGVGVAASGQWENNTNIVSRRYR